MTDFDTPIEPDSIEPPDSVRFGTTGLALVISDYRPGSAISSNIDELLSKIQGLLDDNQIWDLRDATDYSFAKKTRADIRRVRKTINDKYIELKREYEAPLEEFHQEVKRLLIPLDEADRSFKDALDNFDRKREAQRSEFLAEQYEQLGGILAERVPFKTFIEVRGERAKNGDLLWLRNSTLEMAAVESMTKVLNDMLGEWDLLETIADTEADVDLLRSYYLQSLDFKAAVSDYKAVKAHEKVLREEREREAEWLRQQQEAMAQQEPEDAPEPEAETADDDAPRPWRVTAIEVFTGTTEQMEYLQDALADLGFSHIRIEAVDDEV